MTTTDVVPVGEYETGLEDLALLGGGAVTPRIVIDHDEGMFKESNSGELFDELLVIPLGVVAGRALWPPNMRDDGEQQDPLCRSLDAKLGAPGDDFPWKASGWKTSDVDAEGHLDCSACPLKEWGSHPAKDTAWCQEQLTIPMLRQTSTGKVVPVIMTFKSSGIAPARKYVQSFANNGEPCFLNYLTLTLEGRKRGKNDYYVPVFKKGPATDDDAHEAMSEQYRTIRDFLQTPFVRGDSDETEEVEAEVVAPTPKAKPGKKKPAPAPVVEEAEVVDEEDEEIARLEAALAAKRAAKAPAADDNDDAAPI